MKMFFLHFFLLCCLCAAQMNIQISQSKALPLLKPGEPATIKCYINSKTLEKRVWYKLTAGRKLQLVATADHRYNRSVISDKFPQRYSVEFDRISNHLHLSISKTSQEDTGTYFCGVMQLNEIHFGSGTFLMVKESCVGFSAPSRTSTEVHDEGHLKTKRSNGKRDNSTWSECVYISVKKHN